MFAQSPARRHRWGPVGSAVRGDQHIREARFISDIIAMSGPLNILGQSVNQSSPHFDFLAEGLQPTGEFPEVIGLFVDQEAVFQAPSLEDFQAVWVRIAFDREKFAIEVNAFELGIVPYGWNYRFKENLKFVRQPPFIPGYPKCSPDPVVPTTTVQAGQPIAVKSGDGPG